MANYFCEYCGTKASSVASLVASTCVRHPNGTHKGRHKLYEGNESTQYTCKHCGIMAPSIASLTASSCKNHPNGTHKGHHAPML